LEKKTRDFQDLIAWQKAMDFAVEIHTCCHKLPKYELFGLASQMRRGAVSVPSNIAEGQGRGPGPDFIRFLRVALGSLQETQTQLLLAVKIGYLSEEDIRPAMVLSGDVNRLCRKLIQSLVHTPNFKLQTPN
jgi:four helix bundle protein